MHFVLNWALVLALLAALGFGFMAYRAGQSLILWAVAGWFIGLIVAGICLGIGEAVSIPFSDAERAADHARAVAVAAVLVVLLGALATSPLQARKRKDTP